MRFRPADLTPVREAFDDSRYLYELTRDGFRALAYIRSGHCQLVSRRGNVYKSFGSLSAALGKLDYEAVLDGEIVVLDAAGRSQFYELLRRRGEPIFYAFDCLSLEGRDLRPLPLIQRKQTLERVVKGHDRILYARHVESDGAAFFRLVCERDLEGIVAKLKHGTYGEGWFKIRNPGYSSTRGDMSCSRSVSVVDRHERYGLAGHSRLWIVNSAALLTTGMGSGSCTPEREDQRIRAAAVEAAASGGQDCGTYGYVALPISWASYGSAPNRLFRQRLGCAWKCRRES